MSLSTWLRVLQSTRKPYLNRPIDRSLVVGGVILLAAAVLALNRWQGVAWDWFHSTMVVVGFFGLWLMIYLLQEPAKDEFGNYSLAITKIENISSELSHLLSFLKQERQKVSESEATLKRLHNETRELEPVVRAQRDTVDAILGAYARATASRVWKERVLGFMSGLIASLLAAMVFEYFKHK